MSDFQCTNCYDAQLLQQEGAILFDIRDIDSYQQAHPKGAQNFNNDNLQQLLAPVDKDQVILMLCYHGISSQGAAQFISAQGFNHVHSVDGGFAAWQIAFPDSIENSV